LFINKNQKIMKKSFFIILSLSLIFSNCQQNNPIPNAACGTIDATVNTTALSSYNPVANCTQGNIYVNTNSQEQIILSFYSQCSSPQGAEDWLIIINFALLNSPTPIQLNTQYQWITPGPNSPEAIINTITYEAKNCGASAIQYMNITGGTSYNGTFTFTQIDTANKLISGSCTNVTLNPTIGTGPSLPFSCVFTNVPYN
jgi:hypothetical protein